jgi:hypothetical protein
LATQGLMNIEDFFDENRECFDRFTFDEIFKYLLSEDYSHEEAKDLILFNCSLSAIVFQERIDNGFYETIEVDDEISSDMREMKNEIFNTQIIKHSHN